MKTLWKIVGPPVLFLAAYGLFAVIWNVLHLPSDTQLLAIAKTYFQQYGLLTVFVSAILEGMLFVGLYYPGSVVIFLGVILAGKNVLHVTEVVMVVMAGFLMAYVFNYMLGRYGWYRLFLALGLRKSIENARVRLTKYGASGIFASYWVPNLASFTSTAAGILSFPFRTFLWYSVIAVVVWDIFWGALVYFLGNAALSVIGFQFVIGAFFAWVIARFIMHHIPMRREHDYILVISPRFTYVVGIISGTPSQAKAAAFWPFIVVRSEDVVAPWLLNHERIHHRQQKELLLIGFPLLLLVEALYFFATRKGTFADAYTWHSSEQEAYLNQNDLDYLTTRQTWQQFYYIGHKEQFSLGEHGEVVKK